MPWGPETCCGTVRQLESLSVLAERVPRDSTAASRQERFDVDIYRPDATVHAYDAGLRCSPVPAVDPCFRFRSRTFLTSGRARVLTDNEEDDPPPPTPFAVPSRPAPTLETLSLWLRRHLPAPPLSGLLAPPSRIVPLHLATKGTCGSPTAQSSRPSRAIGLSGSEGEGGGGGRALTSASTAASMGGPRPRAAAAARFGRTPPPCTMTASASASRPAPPPRNAAEMPPPPSCHHRRVATTPPSRHHRP
uniref:Uncharacterized protein n=1 Tax=Oryza sativa subsp. japonica TaxID=39947 RepID=Q6EPM8_ORYSJ|nr:hypothetical protein [Oryza sativa Japonica Group]